MKKIQSDFKFEDLKIGQEVIEGFSSQKSTITNLTTNSIEVFMTAYEKSLNELGEKKGIDGKCWFTLDQFNRRFI